MLTKARSAVKGIASGLRTVLNVTKEVSDAFPPLKGVVSGLLAVWDVYEVWICDNLMNQGTLLCSMQSHSSNEDTRKKLKKHIESLKSIVEAIDSRKDKGLPVLKKVLERFTMYAPWDTYSVYCFSHFRNSGTSQQLQIKCIRSRSVQDCIGLFERTRSMGISRVSYSPSRGT